MSDKTFGQFYDEVAKIDLGCAMVWLDGWVALLEDERWQAFRKMPLLEGVVRHFAADMRTCYLERMWETHDDELHESHMQDGQEFMGHILEVAKRFGCDVSSICSVPMSPSEVRAKFKKEEQRKQSGIDNFDYKWTAKNAPEKALRAVAFEVISQSDSYHFCEPTERRPLWTAFLLLSEEQKKTAVENLAHQLREFGKDLLLNSGGGDWVISSEHPEFDDRVLAAIVQTLTGEKIDRKAWDYELVVALRVGLAFIVEQKNPKQVIRDIIRIWDGVVSSSPQGSTEIDYETENGSVGIAVIWPTVLIDLTDDEYPGFMRSCLCFDEDLESYRSMLEWTNAFERILARLSKAARKIDVVLQSIEESE